MCSTRFAKTLNTYIGWRNYQTAPWRTWEPLALKDGAAAKPQYTGNAPYAEHLTRMKEVEAAAEGCFYPEK
jgi:hypothetical protein